MGKFSIVAAIHNGEDPSSITGNPNIVNGSKTLRDATMRSRQLDQLTEANIEAMELPFEVNE